MSLVLSLSSFRENKRHEKVPHGGLGSFRCGRRGLLEVTLYKDLFDVATSCICTLIEKYIAAIVEITVR